MHSETSNAKSINFLSPRRPKQLGVRSRQSTTLTSEARRNPRNNKYQTDPRLVDACLKGDDKAWNELIERYKRLLCSIPRQYGLSTADAEDVMQNVLEIVYRRLETLRDHTILSAWIIRITHRATLHYLKKGHNDCELLDEVCSPEKGENTQIERLETQHLVRQALQRLDSQSRLLVEALLSDAPPSYAELAEQLECPVGSIGPTRARAFKKLEVILREMEIHLD